MRFPTAARNFVILMSLSIVLLMIDLVKWLKGGQTWSEAIWEVNQKSLAVAFGTGMVCGHLFTVPTFPNQISMSDPQEKTS